MCIFGPVGSAYGSASRMKLGLLGHALAMALGLTIGLGFAWTLWASTSKFAQWIQAKPTPFQNIGVVCFGLLAVAWILTSGFAGGVLPLAILRLIF